MSEHDVPTGHVFLSYVREDAKRVDRLQDILEGAGFRVWRDTADLWPGQDWRLEIQNAITAGALAFVACFSTFSAAREISYQNEELNLAVDQMRQRPPGRIWLLPVRFDPCVLPTHQLGPGRTLDSLQRVDLFDGADWERAVGRLIASITMILSKPTTPPPAPPTPSPIGKSPARQLRDILLRPDKQIEVEDRFMDTTKELCATLIDATVHPWNLPDPLNNEEGVRLIASQATEGYSRDG